MVQLLTKGAHPQSAVFVIFRKGIPIKRRRRTSAILTFKGGYVLRRTYVPTRDGWSCEEGVPMRGSIKNFKREGHGVWACVRKTPRRFLFAGRLSLRHACQPLGPWHRLHCAITHTNTRSHRQDLETPQTRDARAARSMGLAPVFVNASETAAETHAVFRARSGFDVNQLDAEYRALRASVLGQWVDDHSGDSLLVDDIMRFNEAIDQALVESSGSSIRKPKNPAICCWGCSATTCDLHFRRVR